MTIEAKPVHPKAAKPAHEVTVKTDGPYTYAICSCGAGCAPWPSREGVDDWAIEHVAGRA